MSAADPHPSTAGPPAIRTARPQAIRTTAPWAIRTAALIAILLGLGGCALRWESPEPAQPIPSAAEQARQRAAASAVELIVITDQAGSGADPAATQVLNRISAFSTAHLEALGGVAGAAEANRPTTPPTTPTGPVPAPAGSPGVEPDAVLALLLDGYDSARRDAISTPDGSLARLLASIATARLMGARDLAVTTGLAPPDLPATDPSGAATPSTEAGPSQAASPSSAAGPAAPSGLAGLAASVGQAAAVTMALAHDQAGYADEVVAARSVEAVRDRAVEVARRHRAAGRDWAAAAGIAGTDADPRQVAYALPAELIADQPADPAAPLVPEAVATAVVQRLETSIAADYATLVGHCAPDQRATAVDAFTAAIGSARAWGVPPDPFPGMPELSV